MKTPKEYQVNVKSEVISVRKLRAELRKQGFKLKKGRDVYNCEGYMITDSGNFIVCGENFELDLEDVAKFIREEADDYNERCLQREIVMDMRYNVVKDILQDFGIKIPFAEWSDMQFCDLVRIYDNYAWKKDMPPYIIRQGV